MIDELTVEPVSGPAVGNRALARMGHRQGGRGMETVAYLDLERGCRDARMASHKGPGCGDVWVWRIGRNVVFRLTASPIYGEPRALYVGRIASNEDLSMRLLSLLVLAWLRP